MTAEIGLTFPCELAVKVFGRNDSSFRATSVDIVRKHYSALSGEDVREQPSRNGNYLSLTFHVFAQSRDEIDALYRELTAAQDIVMVI